MYIRVLFVFLCSLKAFSTGAPVFDVANWLQHTKMIINQASEYKTQIEQYHNQIQQYQNMLKNTESLTTYQWDNANGVINNLLEATNTIDYYKSEAGSLEAYLDRFQSQEYYQKIPFFHGEELKKISQNKLAASVAQKRANDAMLKGIDRQQQNLKKDLCNFAHITSACPKCCRSKTSPSSSLTTCQQSNPSTAANKRVIHRQQNAEVIRDAANANKEAIQTAADERFRAGSYHKSSGKKW